MSMETVATMIKWMDSVFTRNQGDIRENDKELNTPGFNLGYTGKIKSRNGVGIIVENYLRSYFILWI